MPGSALLFQMMTVGKLSTISEGKFDALPAPTSEELGEKFVVAQRKKPYLLISKNKILKKTKNKQTLFSMLESAVLDVNIKQ